MQAVGCPCLWPDQPVGGESCWGSCRDSFKEDRGGEKWERWSCGGCWRGVGAIVFDRRPLAAQQLCVLVCAWAPTPLVRRPESCHLPLCNVCGIFFLFRQYCLFLILLLFTKDLFILVRRMTHVSSPCTTRLHLKGKTSAHLPAAWCRALPGLFLCD